MSKQFIQFASVLFMLAALLAVSAEENTTALNNATLNNTTLNASVIEAPILPTETANETAQNETVPAENEAVPAASVIIPVQNKTVPVQNETPPAQIELIATQNETAPAQNITLSENVTAVAEPITTAGMNNTTLLNNTILNASLDKTVDTTTSEPVSVASQPGAMQIGSPQRDVFVIGGGEGTQSLFPIDSKALTQGAYEVGLPAKTIMDLSALPFFVNKI